MKFNLLKKSTQDSDCNCLGHKMFYSIINGKLSFINFYNKKIKLEDAFPETSWKYKNIYQSLINKALLVNK